MARPRTLSDEHIFSSVLSLLADQGEKAVTFGNLSRATGLAPATLAQRFGTVDGMFQAAILAEWARLCDQITQDTHGDAEKGAQALLKRLSAPSPAVLAISLRDPVLRTRMEDWRKQLELSLATRRGTGAKGKEMAAILLAAWFGRESLQVAGPRSFKLSDLMKRLG